MQKKKKDRPKQLEYHLQSVCFFRLIWHGYACDEGKGFVYSRLENEHYITWCKKEREKNMVRKNAEKEKKVNPHGWRCKSQVFRTVGITLDLAHVCLWTIQKDSCQFVTHINIT